MPTGCSCWCAPTRTPSASRPASASCCIKLDTPGIRIRPIVTIADDDELSESFFDDVVVPAENLVGALHGGWAIANDLLAHERLGIANPQVAIEAIARIEAIGRANGAIDDPVFRDRLAGVRIKVVTQAALFSHAVSLTASGRHLGPDAAILKLVATDNPARHRRSAGRGRRQPRRRSERACRSPAATSTPPSCSCCRGAPRIYGGSSEILRNIVARRVLNLPG